MKKNKIKFHPFAKEDIRRMPEKDKDKITEAIEKLSGMSPKEMMETGEPVNMEKLKNEDPELYKELLQRIKELEDQNV